VQQQLTYPAVEFAGNLSFPQIGALAAGALLYLGNDTGLTHLAAASGGRTVMILGPSDPARYAPFTPDSLALWKPVTLRAGGVAAADVSNWDWERDGIAPEDVLARVRDWLASK
jgi:ADP-heptose:LPS heptosyltransferase